VYCKLLRITKPNSSVPGDVPIVLIKRYTYLYAGPATTIFNRIIETSTWPRQWVREHAIVLSKLKAHILPQNEDDLRTISKTAFLSKCFENILGDYILPIIDKYIDPGQCVGLIKSSINHYLVKLLDFAHRTLDKKKPHCAVLCTENLSKAYNRGSHNLVVEDLDAMHVPAWITAIICSYLKGRSLELYYLGANSSSKSLPGGFGAGTFLGGLLFLVIFNGACLRPPIPRPLTNNQGMQVKFVNDACQIASINLKKSLIQDPVSRPRPWNYEERTGMVLNLQENVLQSELENFYKFTQTNKLVINQKKCFVMKFSRSRKYDFPTEFSIGKSSTLEVKSELKILGVIVQSSLKWDSQCTEMVRRATNCTWVIRRMKSLGVRQSLLVEYWKSEGRVMLEYACPVWHSSLTVAQSRSLDRAQRVAMAAITGRWVRSHTAQLRELGLERLELRRQRICERFGQRTATNSRHQDMFRINPNNRTRGGQNRGYIEINARTASYHKSALPYLTRQLNNH
jgi:hypothetical protein